ncbi:uncharacterized protein BDR25DRAFT_353058 [Lindgomyces ingoldianus]|uniref:Uncharacterized protein n=1 Tax=Lindgomyces ingoldianus TaxID=673940 RepID=A0ACB6R2R8_9PLEO|nr:uncharacterized protein BDR25DRAFT_353058 [Lindgomyces ingoldianus]KAF2472731.1 hypothetical protein BDR25DRAFT_353058 [Lindgomyces ingoldianus]
MANQSLKHLFKLYFPFRSSNCISPPGKQQVWRADCKFKMVNDTAKTFTPYRRLLFHTPRNQSFPRNCQKFPACSFNYSGTKIELDCVIRDCLNFSQFGHRLSAALFHLHTEIPATSDPRLWVHPPLINHLKRSKYSLAPLMTYASPDFSRDRKCFTAPILNRKSISD